MKKPLAPFLLLLSAIPFAVKLPYCIGAMRASPAEHWNWCFLLLAIVAAAIAAPKAISASRNQSKATPLIYATLIPGLLFLLIGSTRQIHLLAVLGSIMLPYSLVFSMFGWETALFMTPFFGLLFLFSPNVGLLLSSFLSFNDMTIKVVVALCLVALLPIFYLKKKYAPRPGTFLFGIAVIALVTAYLASGHYSAAMRPALRPDFSRLASGDFRGIQEFDISNDRAAFGDSDIHRFSFCDKDDASVSILEVGNIQNIHNIHPTTFCVRISGYEIISEHPVNFVCDGQTMDAQEISARRNGKEFIFWQWYTTSEKSTASFLIFRSIYSQNADWTVYLLATDASKSTEAARDRLTRIIQAFK